MPKNSTILQIELMFKALDKPQAVHSLPPPGALSELLNKLIKGPVVDYRYVDASIISVFATASIEMWHRAIHSFLVSVSLTKASPVWSSVSGYYSSHYTMRAFAHLLGLFQLHKAKKGIRLDTSGSRYVCHIFNRGATKGEHSFYWKEIKKHKLFTDDSLFTENNFDIEESDSGHRNKANYWDHINIFPQFLILNDEYLKNRLLYMSRYPYPVKNPPIPNKSEDSFPDLDNVQLVAYYRLIKYRLFLDDILDEDRNRFWSHHRRPTWCPSYFNFQAASSEYITSYMEILMDASAHAS